MNLLDTIRSNSSSLAGEQQGVQDQSSELQRLLRAKSGKSVGAPGVVASNLGEQQAVQDTNTTMQNQIAPQAQLQNTGIQQQAAGQQQAEQIQSDQIAQNRKFDTIQNRLQTNSILSDLERNKGQIDLSKDKARLEQLGFQLRLQDQQYLDNLKREGATRRLDNDVNFKQELTSSLLGNNQQLLEKQLGNKSVLDASDIDFKKSMAQMDMNTAYDMFKNEMATDKQRALWSSVGAGTTAAIGAYGTYENNQDKKAAAAKASK